MKVFISPHADDETLWGSFTLLREKPHVVFCLRCDIGNRATLRESEAAKATAILGVTREQWDISESNPDWGEMLLRFWALRARGYETAWIPKPEPRGGHPQHDKIGQLAATVWPEATRYSTYNRDGKTRGNEVPFHPDWVALKMRALACYESQAGGINSHKHFLRDQREYTAE